MAAEFPGSIRVRTIGMRATSDPVIWAYASAHGFSIVSKDSDFQQRVALHGHPPKVIWILLGNCPTAAVAALMLSKLAEITAFELDPTLSFLALS